MSNKDKRIERALSIAKRMSKSKKAEGGTAGGIPLTPGIFTEMDKQFGPAAWRGSTIKNQGIMKVPIKEIEHGEAAMPGGTLTWPNARELIQEYASNTILVPLTHLRKPTKHIAKPPKNSLANLREHNEI